MTKIIINIDGESEEERETLLSSGEGAIENYILNNWTAEGDVSVFVE